MLKAMFKPFFKKFFGLFVSMTFVSLLAIALLSCFGSAMSNLKHTYENYIAEYANLDEQVSVKGFVERSTLLSVKDLDEVQEVDARLTIDCYLKKENLEENKSRTIVARIFSFNEKENVLFKRYVTESVTPSTDHVNVSAGRSCQISLCRTREPWNTTRQMKSGLPMTYLRNSRTGSL